MLKAYIKRERLEAGCDEAGRGCLAGPVSAAAVILPPDFNHPLLNDSKKLSEKDRDSLRPIIEREAISWSVSLIEPDEIDKINILNASFLGMHKALEKLEPNAEFILVDGNRFKPFHEVPFECFVKGDGRFASIAAASILAKTHRDEYMKKIHEEHPEFNWQQNKGYPTIEHRLAVKEYGSTEYHRKSFKVNLPEQGKLF